MGVGTEGGELLDIVKKNQFYGKPVDWVNVREEIGDVLWYLALLGRASGSTLEECGTINGVASASVRNSGAATCYDGRR